MQWEGQLVIDMSLEAGAVGELMRVRVTAGYQNAESREDPVHINTVNCHYNAK